MSMDICVESYGMVVHALDTGFMSHLSNLTYRTERLQKLRRDTEGTCVVKQQADQLPFDQANALWLVDVCGCSYEQAAAEMRTDRTAVSTRVTAGRTSIRSGLKV